jgi:sulfur-carrier protein
VLFRSLVWVPALMRDLTGNRDRIEVPGSTVRQVVENLEAVHPGMRARLCEGDDLSPRVSVIVDGQVSRMRLNQTVEENSQVRFVPVLHGG